LQIHWHGVDAIDDDQRVSVERRLRELEQGHQDLIDVRISAQRSGHHRFGEQEVRIACQARGKELVAARTRAEVGAALDEALDAFEREVRRLRDRRRDRRHDLPPEPPHLGIVDRVMPDEGYGFILTDAGDQVYFHRNAVKHGLEFERLEEGARVALNVEPGEKGPQANAVYPPPPGAPRP
jgi:ribosomal subunit interface protein